VDRFLRLAQGINRDYAPISVSLLISKFNTMFCRFMRLLIGERICIASLSVIALYLRESDKLIRLTRFLRLNKKYCDSVF